MKCDEIRELISCMLDNELNEHDSAKVTDHLAGCPECMRVFEAFTAISVSLDHLEEVPEGFTGDVMARVRKAEQQKRTRKTPRLRIIRTAAMAACLALVLLAGTQFADGPLYVGNGGIDVADFTRTGQDKAFTPVTPAPTPEQTPYELIDPAAVNEESGIMSMSAEDLETDLTEAVLPTPTPAAVPEVTPTPVITPTPVPAVTPTPMPSPVLLLKSDLLIAAEVAQPGKYPEAPAVTVTVKDASGKENSLKLWMDHDRIYCENTTAGTAYYTIGTAAQLEALTGQTVVPPTPAVSASPAPAE